MGNVADIDPAEHRRPGHDIEPQFWRRWSPRAMTGEPVGERELARLFEAARWAPSSYNAQPWRFLYARRDTPHWPRFFDLLVEGNKLWCAGAGALLVMASRTTFEHNGKPAPTHSFDTGAAWLSVALQGAAMGLVVHGMQGFDYERAARELGIPPGYRVEAMAAVGRPGEVESLPEKLRERELPSSRKPLADIAREGSFWPDARDSG